MMSPSKAEPSAPRANGSGERVAPSSEERAPYTIEEGTMSTKGMSRRNFLALGSLAAVAGGAALAKKPS